MNTLNPRPYQKAFVGAAAVAFLYTIFLALTVTRQAEVEFKAGNWGYLFGPFVFATVAGTLAAGYWTQKSSKDPSFARAALRGAAIALCLVFLQAIGRIAEQQEKSQARIAAIARWKLEPMPVQAVWLDGWHVQPVSFDDRLPGFIQEGKREAADTISYASLACMHRSIPSTDLRLDEMLKSTADGVLAKFKAQDIDLFFGATGDGVIGPHAGRRLEFDSKNGATALHGEILAADAPACRLLIIAYHGGEPYNAEKGNIDRFKASVK